MKLKQVQITNFRSIKNETITFSPKCRVLVGINESGKSNILDALSLLSKEIKPKPDDEREQLPDEVDNYEDPEILFVFDISEDIDSIYDAISSKIIAKPDEKIVANNSKNYTIKQFCDSFKEGLYSVNIREATKTSNTWEIDNSEYKIINGWKKPSPTCPETIKITDLDGSSKDLKKISIIKPIDEWNISEEHLVDASFEDLQSIIDEEINNLIENNLPEVVYWKYSDNQLLPERIPLADFILNTNKYIPLMNMFYLANEPEIKEAIELAKKRGSNPLNNLLKRVATKNTNYFQKVWKEYKDIKFSLVMDGEFIKCSVTEKNDFSFEKRSDGFKKFVAFLLTVSTKSNSGNLNNALVLVDEPDASLHPSGARYLRDELIKISKNNFVIYSTHSIFMIDRHNINRHLIVTKENEITTTQEADEGNVAKEEVIFNAINYSTFENLKEINIILEGWRDRQLLEATIKNYETNFYKNIGIAHANGVSSYTCFIPTLELAERKVLIVSDSDTPAKNAQKDYTKLNFKTLWKRYDEISTTTTAKTGEDFLKKDYIISKLKIITKQHGNEILLKEENIPENNRLDYIKQQLRSNNFNDGQIKEILNDIKTALFEKLSKSKIEDRYQIFLHDLKTYIETYLI